MTSIPTLVGALAIEAGSFWLLAGAAEIPIPPAAAFSIAHAVACVLFARVFHDAVFSGYGGSPLAGYLFGFCIALLFPLFGMIGLIVVFALPLLQGRSLASTEPVTRTRSIPLPRQPASASRSRRRPNSGYLSGILQHSHDPQERLAALRATLSLQDEQQMLPLLRLALKDSDDGVRLLAYAMLDRKERTTETRVRQQEEELETAAPGRRYVLHKLVAHHYWELERLASSAGNTVECMRKRAREHAEAALEIHPEDGGLQYLLGHILLRGREVGAAKLAFERARDLGIDPGKTSFFLAEIAFREKRFPDVDHHLRNSRSGGQAPNLDFQTDYWRGATV
jgi:hypothetical protein